ncbi:solute carrier family 35 member F2-like isoform X1 [Astyanax mexicanus]|uniref:Solute carrier family 35 member F2-like isoform X1 n=1 Tax=Astyanax mexicanus TaxID=7994 RepID=A0A8T2L8C5_ASTMX|nr:solute carrier family 35 member F2-like isoform X1 [Astyanax mexicanus]
MNDTQQGESFCGKVSRQIKNYKWREIFTWQLLKTLLMGQGLSALICGTAVTSQYLASTWNLDVPMLQSFINYTLLFFTYTTALLFRTGDGNILQILKTKWWKYILLGLADVEANYAVVKAYQYTTLTSIQLLDCFIIPVLMILSWFFLKARYRIVHYVAVCVCLAGVGAMVGADLIAGRDQGSTSNILLGDGLVILSASLYAISNVCQEYTVKNRSRVEFLGMLGLFGMLISGIQLGILEHAQIANIQWTWQIVLLLSGFGLCMYALYSCMPLVVKLTSATAVNLSLLTADLFSLFCGLFLFQYSFSGLYIVSLVTIMVGFITFNAVPTPSPPTESVCEEGGYDNQGAELDEEGQVGYAVDNTCEDQGKEKSESSSRGKSHSSETRCVIISRTEM